MKLDGMAMKSKIKHHNAIGFQQHTDYVAFSCLSFPITPVAQITAVLVNMASHCILWNVITYPCHRHLLLAPNSSYKWYSMYQVHIQAAQFNRNGCKMKPETQWPLGTGSDELHVRMALAGFRLHCHPLRSREFGVWSGSDWTWNCRLWCCWQRTCM